MKKISTSRRCTRLCGLLSSSDVSNAPVKPAPRSHSIFPDVQTLCLLHLFSKIGWAASDAVTHLKFVEKGLGREDLAIAVLIDFPFQIFGGYVAGKWSRGDKPLRPWMYAFWPRLLLALVSALTVYGFPKPPIHLAFFVFLVVQTVVGSFSG